MQRSVCVSACEERRDWLEGWAGMQIKDADSSDKPCRDVKLEDRLFLNDAC